MANKAKWVLIETRTGLRTAVCYQVATSPIPLQSTTPKTPKPESAIGRTSLLVLFKLLRCDSCADAYTLKTVGRDTFVIIRPMCGALVAGALAPPNENLSPLSSDHGDGVALELRVERSYRTSK